MSTEPPTNSSDASNPDFAAEVRDVRFEDELEQSYIDYAMSVIAGRALPDARDGLKPVHRRILYAMHEDGVTSNSGHRKSSSIVGTTMGDYHPHGDSAIYDTLVGMAQPFSMRHPLVDGQGNFGSIDDDPAAAMRYTEARMSPISEELLSNIEENTVDFESNYDDRLEEPTVLPASFPNLLVNGSTGIAVGMSTKIPPHNLGEIIDATTHLISYPDASIDDLMEHVPGPDFPTGATIVGRNGIYEAYKSGRGKVRMRADYEIKERDNGSDRIIITEIPYQEKKARMIERIADDVTDGDLEGVTDIRDESDRDGIRVVIDLKRSANTDVVENKLLDNHLETTFGVHMLALVDGQPQVLNLKEALQEFIDHRREVVRRRSQFELDEAEDRAHILEGRLKALDNAEDIVELIQDSEDRDTAVGALEDEYDFSEAQAEHICRMQLGSLTSMEATEIKNEYEDVQTRIEELTEILENDDRLDEVIIEELDEIKESYADDRRTSIIEDSGSVTHEDLIPQEDIIVTLTEDDYIKRMGVTQFDTQNRGGKGIIGIDLKDSDTVSEVFVTNTHADILCFTNHGQVYQLKGYDIPEFGRTARGQSAVNVLDLGDGEEVTALVDAGSFSDDQYVSMVTEQGYVKRTEAGEFQNIRSTGIIAAKLGDDDELVDVEITDGNQDLVLTSKAGKTIRFDETDVRSMGRTARGVHGMQLEGDDTVGGMVAANGSDKALLTITENGYGKRTALSEYRQQSRNGKGVIDIKTEGRNGPVADVKPVAADDEFIVMSHNGQIMRTSVADISEVSRNTKGVTIMSLEEMDTVASIAVGHSALAEDESDAATGDEDSTEETVADTSP
ncbi:DNA gyrase subunit A [Salinibaculum rarum]|uniref:DNA gyrase subunit A n=1 Tax=Salinibaculum rarum TaxID=3058903 RepID=UPI00265E9FCD|nr:DNA gyrase subunit A [Salinibaculum sp. KK48]